MPGESGVLGGNGRAAESLEAEQFQPMRMLLPGHNLRGAFAHALGPLASREGAVIQEEAEQVQIPFAQLAAEKEVIAEAPVEVLDQGTAPMGFVHRVGDGIQNIMENPA